MNVSEKELHPNILEILFKIAENQDEFPSNRKNLKSIFVPSDNIYAQTFFDLDFDFDTREVCFIGLPFIERFVDKNICNCTIISVCVVRDNYMKITFRIKLINSNKTQ